MAAPAAELPLVMLGSGGLARELLGWMSRGHAADMPVAFIHHETPAEPEILGLPVQTMDGIEGPVRFIVGIAHPKFKRKSVEAALARGWQPQSYVDATALIGLDVRLGTGSVVCPFCTVSTGTTVGDFVTMNCRAALGHGSVLGEYTTLLGSNSVNGEVTVGRSVLMGTASIVHPGRRVGDGATVGIGAVVMANVRAGTTVFGNPARVIK